MSESSTDDMPMCPICFAILSDDGTCPEPENHEPEDFGPDDDLQRLARVGAWVIAHPAAEWIEDEYIAASLTGEAVRDYRSEAIAAGGTA
jgi:hypothetical protein